MTQGFPTAGSFENLPRSASWLPSLARYLSFNPFPKPDKTLNFGDLPSFQRIAGCTFRQQAANDDPLWLTRMGVMMCEISSLVRPVAEIFLADRAAGAFSSPFFFLLVVSRLFLSTASMVLGAFTSCCRAAVSWGSRKTDSPPTSLPVSILLNSYLRLNIWTLWQHFHFLYSHLLL